MLLQRAITIRMHCGIYGSGHHRWLQRWIRKPESSTATYYEPVKLLNIVQNTGDEDCCRLFLNGFICESCRTDLMVLKNSIRKQADGNDEVSEHE